MTRTDLPLGCRHAITSAKFTISRFAKQVPWGDFDAWPWDSTTKLCPLTLSAKNTERRSSEKMNMASIALSGLNLSRLASRPDFIDMATQRIPRLHLIAQRSTSQHPDVASPIENLQFGLINSDEMRALS